MNSLDFAINMELEGEKYYREQMLLNKDNVLSVIFITLAQDEKKHAEILQDFAHKKSYELTDTTIHTRYKDLFKDMDQFTLEVKKIPTQLDIYRIALETERKSIDLYKGFLSDAENENEKKLFNYLIKEEETHFEILDGIVLLVNRPEEWIESAEFGIREEY